MNNKTAKLLRNFSDKFKKSYRETKKEYILTPNNKKHNFKLIIKELMKDSG